MLLFTRRAVAAAAACLLAVAGCNADPAEPSPSPVRTARPSPPETSIERQQRLDFEAAEKSYRTFIAEMDRIGKAGGSNMATPVMKENAAGPYLEFYAKAARQQKERGLKYTADTKIGYVRPGAYSVEQLSLEVCEDDSANRVIDKSGKVVSEGQVLKRQLYARPFGEKWKLWDGDELGTATSCAEG